MNWRPEPTGDDGRCRYVGWEHPASPPRASQISTIRFVSVVSVTVKDIQLELQCTGVRDMVLTTPA